LQIIGLRWIVTCRSNGTIKIGCQDHPASQWGSFTDAEIADMDDNASEFWKKHKTTIMALSVAATQQK
jgi:hypothetical protein